MKPFITAAQAAVAAYADRLVLVENGTDVAPGMAGFDVESNGARTLIWADVATFPAVQFDHPDCTGCDVDPSGGSHRHDFSHTLLAGAAGGGPALVSLRQPALDSFSAKWQYDCHELVRSSSPDATPGVGRTHA